MPQQGKNIFTKIASWMPHSTLSHLSFIILIVAFGFFRLRIALRVNFDVFPGMGSFLISGSFDSSTSIIASSLWLKQQLTS
jgi:hypothetical protein